MDDFRAQRNEDGSGRFEMHCADLDADSDESSSHNHCSAW